MPKLAYILLGFLMFSSCSNSSQEETLLTATHPTTQLKADIVQVRSGGLFADKFYVQITNLNDSTSFRLSKDLLKGRGGYESGIGALKWISEDELYIDRAIDDSPAGVIFSLSSVSLRNVGDSLSTLFPQK